MDGESVSLIKTLTNYIFTTGAFSLIIHVTSEAIFCQNVILQPQGSYNLCSFVRVSTVFEVIIVVVRGEVPTGEVPTGEAPTGEAPTGEAPTGEVPT